MPYGVTPASAIFQKKLENELCNVPMTVVKIDDILMSGVDEEGHLKNLASVLKILSNRGLTLNKSKCSFYQQEVEYLGFILDKNGLRMNTEKVKAIIEAPLPTNVTELQSFLGGINYYSKFIPNMASITSPLYELLWKEVLWSWTNKQQIAFTKLKQKLTKVPILMVYDKQLPIKLVCDASSYGVGAVLSHRLFVAGGKEITSEEGTTQGDPIAMAMYALGILPLLYFNFDNQSFDTAKRIAYTDDFTGIGRLQQLKYWWEDINKLGSYIGYFPKATKSYLIVKVEHIEEAKALFSSSKIQITVRGNRHLGAITEDPEFKIEYVNNKVDQWIEQINNLSSIAKTHPHSAYSAFVHGLQHQYTYIMRTIPNISNLLQPLEDAIRNLLLLELLNGYVCNDLERKLFSLSRESCFLSPLNLVV